MHRDEFASMGMSSKILNPSIALFVILRESEIPSNNWCIPLRTRFYLCTASYPSMQLTNPEISDVQPLSTRCYPCEILNNASFTNIIPWMTRCYLSMTRFVIPLSNWITPPMLMLALPWHYVTLPATSCDSSFVLTASELLNNSWTTARTLSRRGWNHSMVNS